MKKKRNTAFAHVTDESGMAREITVLDTFPGSKAIEKPKQQPNELRVSFTFNVDKFSEAFVDALSDMAVLRAFREKYGRDPTPEELERMKSPRA